MEIKEIKEILRDFNMDAYTAAANRKIDGEVWTEVAEYYFLIAIDIFSQVGQKKYQLDMNSKELVGRNDIISRYIFMKSNVHRARKQVSSHIQVWANCKKAPCSNGSLDKLLSRDMDARIFQKLAANFKAFYVRVPGVCSGKKSTLKRARETSTPCEFKSSSSNGSSVDLMGISKKIKCEGNSSAYASIDTNNGRLESSASQLQFGNSGSNGGGGGGNITAESLKLSENDKAYLKHLFRIGIPSTLMGMHSERTLLVSSQSMLPSVFAGNLRPRDPSAIPASISSSVNSLRHFNQNQNQNQFQVHHQQHQQHIYQQHQQQQQSASVPPIATFSNAANFDFSKIRNNSIEMQLYLAEHFGRVAATPLVQQQQQQNIHSDSSVNTDLTDFGFFSDMLSPSFATLAGGDNRPKGSCSLDTLISSIPVPYTNLNLSANNSTDTGANTDYLEPATASGDFSAAKQMAFPPLDTQLTVDQLVSFADFSQLANSFSFNHNNSNSGAGVSLANPDQHKLQTITAKPTTAVVPNHAVNLVRRQNLLLSSNPSPFISAIPGLPLPLSQSMSAGTNSFLVMKKHQGQCQGQGMSSSPQDTLDGDSWQISQSGNKSDAFLPGNMVALNKEGRSNSSSSSFTQSSFGAASSVSMRQTPNTDTILAKSSSMAGFPTMSSDICVDTNVIMNIGINMNTNSVVGAGGNVNSSSTLISPVATMLHSPTYPPSTNFESYSIRDGFGGYDYSVLPKQRDSCYNKNGSDNNGNGNGCGDDQLTSNSELNKAQVEELFQFISTTRSDANDTGAAVAAVTETAATASTLVPGTSADHASMSPFVNELYGMDMTSQLFAESWLSQMNNEPELLQQQQKYSFNPWIDNGGSAGVSDSGPSATSLQDNEFNKLSDVQGLGINPGSIQLQPSYEIANKFYAEYENIAASIVGSQPFITNSETFCLSHKKKKSSLMAHPEFQS